MPFSTPEPELLPLQGVACFNTVQPAGKVRGMLGQPTAYVGQRAGELSDCIAYCTKLETRKPGTEPVILGKPRCLKQVKGERSDLNRAREIIQGHRTWTAVINDRTLCDVLARHPRWAHDVFENRAAKPVDEATSLAAFAGWQHDILRRIGCGGGGETKAEKKVLWFYTEDSIKMLHLHHLASFCQSNRGAYTFNACSEAEGVAHRYQSQPLVICLASGHSPSFGILAAMVSGVLPTGKFEGRQQLRDADAHVCVFADHAPPPKLEGVTEVVDVDEEATDHEA